MPLGQFRMIGFVNANQQGCRLSTGSRALVGWLAEFEQNSATFVGSAMASTRRPSGDNGSFWQSSSKCILPSWMYRITGLLTRFSVCWTFLRPTIGIRLAPRRSSCGALVCGSPRSSNSSGGISTTRVVRRRSWSGSRRLVRLVPCGCIRIWCSSSRTGRLPGRPGTRWWRWPCGRRCGTLPTASSGLVSTRSRPVRVSDVQELIVCGIALPGIGWWRAGFRSTWSVRGWGTRTSR